MQSNKKFFAAGILSYLLWGFLPVMFKTLSDFSSSDIIFFRVCLAAIFIWIFFILTKVKVRFVFLDLYKNSKKQFYTMIILNFLGALCLVLNWLVYAYVVQKISVHTAAVGYLILPIVASILALIILKERLSRLQWIAIGLSSISCYLMANSAFHDVVYMLAVAFTYSFYMISQRRNTYLKRTLNLLVQMVFGIALMLLCMPHITPAQNLGAEFWLHLSVISIFFTIMPLLLNMYALNRINTATLSFLGYINPIIGFLLGLWVYHEKLERTEVIAYTILGVSLVLFNWRSVYQLFKKRTQ